VKEEENMTGFMAMSISLTMRCHGHGAGDDEVDEILPRLARGGKANLQVTMLSVDAEGHAASGGIATGEPAKKGNTYTDLPCWWALICVAFLQEKKRCTGAYWPAMSFSTAQPLPQPGRDALLQVMAGACGLQMCVRVISGTESA
jgi:hypothetical protein